MDISTMALTAIALLLIVWGGVQQRKGNMLARYSADQLDAMYARYLWEYKAITAREKHGLITKEWADERRANIERNINLVTGELERRGYEIIVMQ